MSIPLKILLAIILAVVAICAAIAGFLPPYLAGVESTRRAVDEARNVSTRLVVEKSLAAFNQAPVMLELWDAYQHHGVLHSDVAFFKEEDKGLDSFPVSNMLLALARTVLTDSEGTVDSITLTFTGPRRIVFGGPYLLGLYNESLFFEYYSIANDSFRLPRVTRKRTWETYDVVLGYEANAAAMKLPVPSSAQYIDGVFPGYYSLETLCAAVYPDPFRPGEKIIISAVVTSSFIGPFLSSLLITDNSRIALVHSESKSVLAISWNDTAEIRFEHFAERNRYPANERMRTRTLEEFNDSRVEDAVRYLGGANAIHDLPKPYASRTEEAEDALLIDVLQVSNPKYKIDLTVFSVIPEEELFGSLYSARTISIIVVCCSIVAVIIIGVILALCIVRPLDRLAAQMFETARLKEESESDKSRKSSMLSEVRTLQEAYYSMRGQLMRMKSFLPQSVIHTLMAESGEDSGAEEEAGTAVGDTPALVASYTESRRSSHRTLPRKPSTVLGRAHELMSRRSTNRDMLSLALSSRSVSIAAINVRDWHALCHQRGGGIDCGTIVSQYLHVVQSALRENKGVVDSFQGDHVLATFNAVSHVSIHARRAVNACFTIYRELQGKMRVTAGVATGPAVIGNMGTHDMMRFNCIGSVVGEAWLLERTARYLTAIDPSGAATAAGPAFGSFAHAPSLIVNATTSLQELENHYRVMHAEIAWLPPLSALDGERKRVQMDGRRALLTIPVTNKVSSESEWMYQLETERQSDPFAATNLIYQKLFAEGESARPEIEQLTDADTNKNNSNNNNSLVSGMTSHADLVRLQTSRLRSIADRCKTLSQYGLELRDKKIFGTEAIQ